jgi:hypothetical protein
LAILRRLLLSLDIEQNKIEFGGEWKFYVGQKIGKFKNPWLPKNNFVYLSIRKNKGYENI